MRKKFIITAAVFASIIFLSGVVSAASVEKIVNGGFETTEGITATGWQAFGDGYSTSATAHSGSSAISALGNSPIGQVGAYQRIDLNQTVQQPVRLSAYVKGENIVQTPGSYFGATVYAEIHLASGAVAYWNTIANIGTFDWRFIGFNTASLSSVNGPISYIFLIPALMNATGTAYFDDVSAMEVDPAAQGAVTIMIDDGEVNTYTAAKPILDGFRFKGTVAMPSGFVNQLGYLTVTQLNRLHTAGWEIVSHGINHQDMTLLSAADMENEFSASKSALAAWSPKHFALPFGAYNGDVLATGARYYSSVRAFEQGSNPQGIFPLEIKVRGVVSTTTSNEVASWLSDAKQNSKWLVLNFHTIGNRKDDNYVTSKKAFTSMMQQIRKSGLPVLTYDQAFLKFAALP